MKMQLIYPRWPKMDHQTEFHLPPHGPAVFAAEIPEDIEINFVDENRESVPFDHPADWVALSVMLTCQIPRAFEIADMYRERDVPVIFGGIATMLHAEEVREHADAVFLGEVEGALGMVLSDLERGNLKPIYDCMKLPPDISRVGTARRDILKRELYNYRGVQMLDLVHASRGCRFNCFPCSAAFLGGRKFRPRPIDKVIAEIETIPNNRLFLVDNSLAQDRQWVIDLLTALKPLKKKWVSHPIFYDEQVLKLAADAGCWYVYQAIVDMSDVIRRRIQMLKEHDIGIEGTILLGTDEQDEDYIKRLVDFLLEIELDMAEFTILTPFPHTPVRAQLERQGRILSNKWIDYTCDKAVFQPKNMSARKLESLLHYAWDTFYADGGYQIKMANLFMKVIKREMADGTYSPPNPNKKRAFGKRPRNP